MNKHQKVLNYMLNGKSISSMEAIEKFGATRLSAIIFDLKGKYDVKDYWETGTDRFGNPCKYKRYFIAQSKPKNFFQKLRTWGK